MAGVKKGVDGRYGTAQTGNRLGHCTAHEPAHPDHGVQRRIRIYLRGIVLQDRSRIFYQKRRSWCSAAYSDLFTRNCSTRSISDILPKEDGGAAYTLLVYPYKENPLLVFVLCVAVSGTMEYITGWVLYNVFHTRLWDYNTEIWNYGNIDGYVCLRSVLFFGISGMALIYAVIPLLIELVKRMDPGTLTIVCRFLAFLFVADCISYRIYKSSKGEI